MSKPSIYSAEVDREAAFDGEIPELTEEFFRTAEIRQGDLVLRKGTFSRVRRGRPPQGSSSKVQQSLRLSPEVLDHFRATGPGWQGRIDETLLRHVREAKAG